MEEREWIEVEDWHLRSMKPGARVIEASWGAVELDALGAVIRVAGRWVIGQKLETHVDPETQEVLAPPSLVDTAVQGPHPTPGILLAHGYESRTEWPLIPGDEDKDAPEVETPPEQERTVAETTHVEAQDRSVSLDDPGEMGAPVDVEAGAAAAEQVEAKTETSDYQSPFREVPEGTSAADPAHNPPEGAPAGEQVEDLVQSGAAEILAEKDGVFGVRRFLRGGKE